MMMPPDETQEQLHAQEKQWRERQLKATRPYQIHTDQDPELLIRQRVKVVKK
jgi:hypothetical protein